jgi:hypothetical protein
MRTRLIRCQTMYFWAVKFTQYVSMWYGNKVTWRKIKLIKNSISFRLYSLHWDIITCSRWQLQMENYYRVFDTNCGWVFSLKKYFHHILDIYRYHIYWYVFRVQGCQLCIDPNWCETPSAYTIFTHSSFVIRGRFLVYKELSPILDGQIFPPFWGQIVGYKSHEKGAQLFIELCGPQR